MFPSSGSGVTESLALDQAPFTRMASVGTFVLGCMLLEKSPPLFGLFCRPAPWPHASSDTDKAVTTKKRKHPEGMSLLRDQALLSQSPLRIIRTSFSAVEGPGETPACLARKPDRRMITASAGSSTRPVAGWE